jgi:uncharacterized membrane protein
LRQIISQADAAMTDPAQASTPEPIILKVRSGSFTTFSRCPLMMIVLLIVFGIAITFNDLFLRAG